MAIHARRALVGLVTTAAVLALPAVAAAAPVLAVTQSTTTAGTNPATVTFNSTFTSAPNDVTFALPAGLLANANQGGGACLASSTPNSACIVGTGSVTSGVGPAAPVTLYLVAAPAAGDAAGVALVQGTTTLSTAAVTVRSTDGGLNVAFSNLADRRDQRSRRVVDHAAHAVVLPDHAGKRHADGGRSQHHGAAQRHRVQRSDLPAGAERVDYQGRARLRR